MYDSGRAQLTQLAHAAFTYPIIDNHSHNLLKDTHRSAFPLEGAVSEASGDALRDAAHTAAAYRATKQLAKLFNCEPTFDAVNKARDAVDYDQLCEQCFKPTGIVCLLLDDGLDKHCNDIKWHDRLVSTPSKRIVRVEVLAQKLTKQLYDQGRTDLKSFSANFESLLLENCRDPQVVAFKSIVCYRTGLHIEKPEAAEVAAQYATAISELKTTATLRLSHKALNDYIVRIVLKVAGQFSKPVQFHTGLGDNDLKLVSATPALMQSVIEEFPQTTFVLLHSSYPSTQHAGYLASVYKNVYVDFGEVFPMVSPDGQRTILRQVLELTPTNKILWSTDGHWWPESYYLAAIQVREVLYEVLSDAVVRGDMTEPQAVGVVERALFHNANALYGLNLTPSPTCLNSPLTLTDRALAPPTLDSLAARGTRFVRISWIDYCGLVRNRIIPIGRLQRMVAETKRPGINLMRSCFGIVRCILARGLGPVGEEFMVPDLRSLRVCEYAEGHAFVMGSMEMKEPVELEDGSLQVDLNWDPRTALRRVLKSAKELEDLDFLVGFEIEFTLLRPESKFPTPANDHDYCVAAALTSGSAEAKTLDAIASALEACGIELQQFHSEAAVGQFEVVTGPMPPVEAVDALIATREIIYNVAAKHGLRATLSPRLYNNECGTAMHTHMSVKSSSPRATAPSKNGPFSELEGSFLQSILDHLPAICAFTLSSPASYSRMLDGVWSGGTYVAWGRENRETPVRLCGTRSTGWNFEMKALDGTGNPYLAIAALLYAGLLGIKKSLPLRTQDCLVPPATLSDVERAALGITQRMSLNLEEAINNLRQDAEFNAFFGEELMSLYIASIELRRDVVSSYSEEGQREWMAKFY